MQEYTFSIIKPDAMSRGITKEINKHFTDKSLEVVAQKVTTMTKEQAKEFYIEHKERPFYDSLVEYMTSGPITVQVLKGKDAIKLNREIMGATNPQDAAPGTIRAKYAESLDRNSVHGSDSPEAAKREISMFFDYEEVTKK
ncbi:MAG: nucleoside-diphosphate kinase [Rickettsiales bacterium]